MTPRDLLSKLIYTIDQNGQKSGPFLIYALDESNSHYISVANNQPNSKVVYYFRIVNINNTIILDIPSVDTLAIFDIEEFLKNIEIVKPNDEIIAEIARASNVVINNVKEAQLHLQEMSSVLSTMRYSMISSGLVKPQNSITVSTTAEDIARIIFNNNDGSFKPLANDDLERISQVVHGLVTNNLHMNVESKEDIQNLRSQAEIEIIAAMPDYVNINEINININALIEEIIKARNNTNFEEE